VLRRTASANRRKCVEKKKKREKLPSNGKLRLTFSSYDVPELGKPKKREKKKKAILERKGGREGSIAAKNKKKISVREKKETRERDRIRENERSRPAWGRGVLAKAAWGKGS